MWSEDLGGGVTVTLPAVRLGLVQHEPETLLTPGYDLLPHLRADPGRWEVEAFNERNALALLDAAADYDVVVIGFNALLYSLELRRALERSLPPAPLLVLHQRDPACWRFLGAGHALGLVELKPRARAAWAPRERTAVDEPLLAWTNEIVDDGRELPATAIRAFELPPACGWRGALDVQDGPQRRPVLVRTRSTDEQRLVACSLLLAPDPDTPNGPAHAALLDNLLTYCALGWPDVVVGSFAGAGEAYDHDELVRSIEVWSDRCPRLSVPAGAALPMHRWPLRGTRRLVMPSSFGSTAAAEALRGGPWQDRGGTLVLLGPDSVEYRTGLAERRMLLRRWAAWFPSIPTSSWAGRLSTAVSVVRLLAAFTPEDQDTLDDLLGPAPGSEASGRPAPEAFAEPLRALVAGRLGGDNVDETVSATTAALDLLRLTGQGESRAAGRMRGWLRGLLASPDGRAQVTAEDQLDIIRALADRRALAAHVPAPPALVSALYATRLREAVSACGATAPDDPDELAGLDPEAVARLGRRLDEKVVAEELVRRPLLCAEFLAALHAPPGDHAGPLSVLLQPAEVSRAEATAVAHLRPPDPEAADAVLVCTSTLALLRRAEQRPSGALRALPEAAELPLGVVESVLEEATRARVAERDAQRDLPALTWAALLLGVPVLGFLLWALLGLWVERPDFLRPWWLAAPAMALAATTLAVLRWASVERRLEPERRALRLTQHAVGLCAAAVAGLAATGVSLVDGVALDVIALPVLAVLLLALAFALRRVGLAPPWAGTLVEWAADPAGVVKRLSGRLAPKGAE